MKFDIPITDISEDQHQNWRELLEHSLKFQEGIENKVSKIFLEFKKITDEIKQMDLPKQMEHIFLLKLKVMTMNVRIIIQSNEFKILML